jgi:hypothetical protein
MLALDASACVGASVARSVAPSVNTVTFCGRPGRTVADRQRGQRRLSIELRSPRTAR